MNNKYKLQSSDGNNGNVLGQRDRQEERKRGERKGNGIGIKKVTCLMKCFKFEFQFK